MLQNRTYHLCFSDRKLSFFTHLWMKSYKPCPFTMRNAADNVHDCVVVSIKDVNGEMLEFIAKALQATEAKVVVR